MSRVLDALGAIAVGVLALAALATSASAEPARVVWLAVDGAAWRVIDPLVAAGELPHLAGLRARGCAGELRSLEVSLSPRIWTSQATGAAPEEHGILGFVRPEADARHLYTSREIRLPRVWEIASQEGLRVGVANFWFTYPAAPVHGYVISDHFLPWRSDRMREAFAKGAGAAPSALEMIHPPGLASELNAIVARNPAGLKELAPVDTESRRRVIQTLMAEDRLAFELAAHAEARSPSRLQVIYSKGIDGVSHYFWEFHEPDWPGYHPPPAEADRNRFREAVANAYRHFDELLGERLASLSQNDVVLITSDHGFGAIPRRPGKYITGSHGNPPSRHGIYLASGGPVAKERCPESISLYDVAPTLLHLLGLPASEVMRGRVVESFFTDDWLQAHPPKRIRAYTLPNYDSEVEEVVDEEQRIEWLKTLGYIE